MDVATSGGPLIVPDILAHGVRTYPDRVCVGVGERTLSFAETSARASQVAHLLHERGLGNGGRVALLAYNELEFMEVKVGAQRAGSVFVPLNYRLPQDGLAAIVEDCEPGLLIVGPGFEELGASFDVPWRLQVGGPDDAGSTYEAAIAGRPVAPPPSGFDASRVAMLAYTSGTTATAKGVILSNWSVHATVQAVGQMVSAHPDGTYLAATPLFHVGHSAGMAFTYLGGSHLQLRKFDPDDFARIASTGSFTHSQLVPSMIQAVLDCGGPTPQGLEGIIYGAAPMPPALASRALAAWNCGLYNAYGSTEIMGVSTLPPGDHDPDHRPELLASVGRSAVGTSVRLVDEDDGEVAPGEIGEIIARGPTMMSGYWRRPDTTAEALRGGWMHTGDLGYRDSEGYLYLVDRKHDRIISGGENVYPTKVEHRLREHPDVADAGVVGIADEKWGERVCAAVVMHDGAEFDPEELRRHCRETVASYEVPKEIRAVTELPRNPTGKLLRRELRAHWNS